MDKILSQEERIRRAEEIYAKRRYDVDSRRSATVNVEGDNSKLTKKLVKQFVICLFCYIAFYALKSSPNIISQDIMYKISDVLEYDININELYKNISAMIVKEDVLETSEELQLEGAVPNMENQMIEETLSITEEQSQVEETEVPEEVVIVEETSSLSQMDVDAEYIKANYSMTKPLEGEITSRFGIRNPTTATVPKYHTGIDIARVIGTKIIAAMEGTVELVSSQGAYGNHLKITNGEVSTLYAHCNQIYVKEGDYIDQGQEIAEVGETGNVTGPHLHFEIRRNNQYVDPDLILQF